MDELMANFPTIQRRFYGEWLAVFELGFQFESEKDLFEDEIRERVYNIGHFSHVELTTKEGIGPFWLYEICVAQHNIHEVEKAYNAVRSHVWQADKVSR